MWSFQTFLNWIYLHDDVTAAKRINQKATTDFIIFEYLFRESWKQPKDVGLPAGLSPSGTCRKCPCETVAQRAGLTFELQVLHRAFRQGVEGVPRKVGGRAERAGLPLLQYVLQQLVQDIPCRHAKVRGETTTPADPRFLPARKSEISPAVPRDTSSSSSSSSSSLCFPGPSMLSSLLKVPEVRGSVETDAGQLFRSAGSLQILFSFIFDWSKADGAICHRPNKTLGPICFYLFIK